MGTSAVVAVLYSVFLTARHADFKDAYPSLTWVLGMPVWLAGAMLAEHVCNKAEFSDPGKKIWLWRLGTWGGSVLLGLGDSHLHIPKSASVLLMGILCAFWISQEIAYYQFRSPWKWLEVCGLGSYSIYLLHLLIYRLLIAAGIDSHLGFVEWAITIATISLGVSVLYFCVEAPGHNLARSAGQKIREKSSRPPVTTPEKST